MNFFERTSVKIRFLYLVLVMLLFIVAAALTFVHTIHSIEAVGALQKSVDSHFTELHGLDHELSAFAVALSGPAENTASLQQEVFNSCDAFLEGLLLLKNEKSINNSRILPLLDTISWHLSALKNKVAAMTAEAKAEDSATGYPGTENIGRVDIGGGGYGMQVSPADDPGVLLSVLHSHYIKPVVDAGTRIREALYAAASVQQKKYAQHLAFIFFISIAVIMLSASLSEISNYRNILQLLNFSVDLDRGNRKAKIHLSSAAEFREIARRLNNFLEKQSEKVRFLKTIGAGETQYLFQPENTDILGNEINIMASRLQKSQLEEANRQSGDSRRNWISEGIAQFSGLLRDEPESVRELAYLVIRKLVSYLHIEMGTLFLTMEDEKEEPRLETIAAYAFDRRKYINKTFRFGEGLPGTCALEKEKIYMNDIPESFSDIISGVGQTRPRHALLVPLRTGDEILGVIELASFRALEKHEFDFIDQVADIIASGLQTVRNNERTAALLEQSRAQARQLSLQEEKLRINLQKLEHARGESLKKESEIEGILNAINQSTLVAEFSPGGRFTDINDKFLALLDVTGDMVLGKHHAEFAGPEKYTDAYKKFWETLKSGTPVTKDEKLILYSGKEIWLQQTYTPIRDKEGAVTRILDIAVDITLEKKQHEELESVTRELEQLRKEKG